MGRVSGEGKGTSKRGPGCRATFSVYDLETKLFGGGTNPKGKMGKTVNETHQPNHRHLRVARVGGIER